MDRFGFNVLMMNLDTKYFPLTQTANSCTNLPSLVHSAGPQCWSTVRLGQQTVTYDSNPPAAKDPSAFFCPHPLSEPIQVHVCQSPHSPPPPVFCYYMWKTSKKFFCFFLISCPSHDSSGGFFVHCVFDFCQL